MSQISSNWPDTPSRSATASACLREPLVKMNLRPGQACERRRQSRGGEHGAKIDVVHVIEKVLRRHAMQAHQPGQRGAVLVVIGLAQALRLFERNAETIGDELAHALVDLGEQIAVGRIERVVEIEHPRLDMGETAGGIGLVAH